MGPRAAFACPGVTLTEDLLGLCHNVSKPSVEISDLRWRSDAQIAKLVLFHVEGLHLKTSDGSFAAFGHYFRHFSVI